MLDVFLGSRISHCELLVNFLAACFQEKSEFILSGNMEVIAEVSILALPFIQTMKVEQ